MECVAFGVFFNHFKGIVSAPRSNRCKLFRKIKIRIWTPFLPCTVSQGSKIAQLIFFMVPMSTNTVQKRRGEEGFGSSGAPQIFWTQQLAVQCPTCKCKLS
ncbi:hypothetical protein Nmel_002961 [Mimus melanotis]